MSATANDQGISAGNLARSTKKYRELSASASHCARRAVFIESLRDLSRERDPLEVQAKRITLREAETAGPDDAVLCRTEKSGSWSILQVSIHPADSELVSGIRMRMILAYDEPQMPGCDQDIRPTKPNCHESSLTDAHDQLRVLRRISLKRLQSLNESQVNCVGIHNECGSESLRQMMRLTAGYDWLHPNQIRRIKNAIEI